MAQVGRSISLGLWDVFLRTEKLDEDVVAHTCDSSIPEADEKGLQVPGQPIQPGGTCLKKGSVGSVLRLGVGPQVPQ